MTGYGSRFGSVLPVPTRTILRLRNFRANQSLVWLETNLDHLKRWVQERFLILDKGTLACIQTEALFQIIRIGFTLREPDESSLKTHLHTINSHSVLQCPTSPWLRQRLHMAVLVHIISKFSLFAGILSSNRCQKQVLVDSQKDGTMLPLNIHVFLFSVSHIHGYKTLPVCHKNSTIQD